MAKGNGSSKGKGNGNGITAVLSGNEEDDVLIGGDDDEQINGGGGDDVLEGNGGDDNLNGGDGNDQMSGGAGDDQLNGGDGDDVIRGGADDDRINSGDGDDTVIYNMSDNLGSSDEAKGNSGNDTLFLELTRDQWFEDSVQADIANFLQFLADNVDPTTGEANGKSFTFQSFDLTVKQFENLRVTVDGVELDPRDEAVDAVDDAVTTETEHAIVTGNVLDNDDVPDLVRSVDLVSGPAIGDLTLNTDGTFAYDPGNHFDWLAEGETTTQTFTYQVTDADYDTDTAVVTITITGTNDAPVAVADVGATDEDNSVTIDVLANDTDVDLSDTHTLDSVAVVSGGGSASIVGNQLVYDPGLDYQSLALGEPAEVIVEYVMSDNNGAEATASVTITVTGTNDAPVISGVAAGAADEDGVDDPIVETGQLISTDVDNGATATWSVVSGAGNFGSFGIDQTGLWTYTLDNNAAHVQALAANEVHTETFTVVVTDEHGASDTQDVTVTVTGTNDAPVISFDTGNDAGTVDEDGADAPTVASGQLTSSDVDNGATATWSVVNGTGVYGSLSVDQTGEWTYVLDNGAAHVQALAADESHDEVFTVVVTDDFGATDTQQVTITVTGTNDDPVIADGGDTAGAVEEDVTTSASGQLTSSDVDNGATATWSVENAQGLYGNLSVDQTGQWTYTLDNGATNVQALAANESHDEVFTVVVTDDFGATDTQQVTVTVSGTNDAPVISGAATGTVDEDGIDAPTVISGQLSSSDVDNGATATWSVAGGGAGAYGSLFVDQTGQWTYTLDNNAPHVQALDAGDVETETFAVVVTDDFGATDSQIITITVTGTNDAPTAVADTAETNEDTAITVDLLANDFDIDGDNLVVTSVSTPTIVGGGALPAGSLTAGATPGTYVFRPDTSLELQKLAVGESVDVTFDYTVSDGDLTDTATVTITVDGRNDAPAASGGVFFNVFENGSDFNMSLPGDDIDSDNDRTDLTYEIVSQPAVGSVTPVAGGAPGLFSYSGLDEFDHLAEGEQTTISFQWQVTDRHGAVSSIATTEINITGTNDAPVISGAATGAVDEDGIDAPTMISGQLSSSDVDNGATATWSVVDGAGVYGSLSVDQTGQWTYTLDNAAANVQALAADESHQEVFAVVVTDDKGVTDTQEVTVTVTGTNDAPVITAADASGSVTEDDFQQAVVTGQITANDVDNNSTAAWSVVGGGTGAYGTLSVDQNGEWTYTLDNATPALEDLDTGSTASDTFTVQVDDGKGGVASQVVSITIHGATDNQPPTAQADVFNIDEDVVLNGNVLADNGNGADSDPDNDPITITTTGTITTANGLTVNLGSDGSFTYTPPAHWHGTDSFEYTITDGNGEFSTATATINVKAVADAPGIEVPEDGGNAGTLNVAVTYQTYDTGTTWLVNQLNDSTAFGFSATAVYVNDADSLAELSNYDVVVHGGQYWNSMTPDYWAALRDYVEADEGGVVTTGLYGYNMRYYLSGQARADADFVSPVAFGTVNASYGYEYQPATLTYDTNHDITDGVPSTSVNFWTYYSANLVDSDAVVLGTNPGSGGNSYYAGYTAAYSETEGLGNRAYLGGQYSYSWDGGNLRSGGFDQLLEQAVNWAGNGGALGAEDETFELPIEVNLIDTDGSESISEILISGVPSGASLSAGDDLGGGVWSLTPTQLDGLKITPPENFNGSFDLMVQATSTESSNNDSATTTKTFTVTVSSVNDGPVAVDDDFATAEDTGISGNLLADNGNGTDSDVDGDTLSVINTGTFASANGGTVSISANGDFTYDPAADFNGTDTFEYTISDGHGAESTATVTIDVSSVNDGPTIELPNAGNAALNVAVTYDSFSTGTQWLVNQLNDSTAFGFNATAVHHANADSLAELSNYDVVVHAGLHYNAMSPSYWAALRDYVEADEGGVVTTGLHGYNMRYYLSGQARADADFVSPVAFGTLNASYGYEIGPITLTYDTSHEITDGIAGTTVSGWSYYSANLVDGDAVVLGANPGYSGNGYYSGYTAAYSETEGLGNRAYIGGQFADSWDGGNLRSGAFDQLLEQAVAWAGEPGLEVEEDQSLTITDISVADVDSGTDPIQLTLSVANGTLSLSNTTGLDSVSGDGSGSVVIVGSQAAINAAMSAGVVYQPDPDYNGTETLTAVVNDLGHTGAGGAQETTASTDIVVLPVDEPSDPSDPSDPVVLTEGDEFQVNTYTTGNQQLSNVITLEDGGFVITWQSWAQDGDNWGIFGQRYDADGNAVGNEFPVNSHTSNYQSTPSGAALQDGGFVITWHSENQDGSSTGVYGQRYDADGNPAGGEFQINAYTNNWQNQPSVTTLNDGNFVVTWMSNFQDGSFSGIYAQHFDPSGAKIGSEFQINQTTYEDQTDPDITALADGGYVITWRSFQQDGSQGGIFGRRFDSDGTAVSNEFQINTYTNSEQGGATIAALTGGGFVASWSSFGQDGSDYGIYAQQYDANGAKVGGEFLVNDAFTTGTQIVSDVEGLADGGYVISWQSWLQDGSKAGLMARRYDSDGNLVGDEFRVNDETFGDQARPSISARDDGGFVITWTSFDGQDGSGHGVFAKVYSGPVDNTPVEITEGSEFLVNTTTAGAQVAPDGATLANGDFVVIWQSTVGFHTRDVMGQMYSADGAPIGGEFNVGVSNGYDQSDPVVVGLEGGGFTVIWHSLGQDGRGWGVFARVFDEYGNATGSEIRVNSYVSGQQFPAEATALSDGGFLVAWQSFGPDGSDFAIVAQRFDAHGNALSRDGSSTANDEFVVNNVTSAFQGSVAVTELADGTVVYAWQSNPTGQAFGNEIRARMYDSDGNPLAGEFLVNTENSSDQGEPEIAALEGGGFVITWQSDGPNATVYDVFAQIYDASGNAVGGEFKVNTFLADYQVGTDIVALNDGGFVIGWRSTGQDGSDGSVHAQRYDAEGNTVGGEFQINDTTQSWQAELDLIARDDGGFTALWMSRTADSAVTGDGWQDGGVMAKIYAGPVDVSGLNEVSGTSGNDALNSTDNDDLLSGDDGNDLFVFDGSDGNDVIDDFTVNVDDIDLSLVSSLNNFADVQNNATQVGANTVIQLDGDDSVTLIGVDKTDLDQDDFLF